MTEKISDERLKILHDTFHDWAIGSSLGDVYEEAMVAIDELLALRSLNKRLVADGERLAKELEGAIFVIDEFPIDYSNGITWNGIDEGRVKGAEMEHKMREDGHKAIDQHAALLKDLE